jgi:hypothetical protein
MSNLLQHLNITVQTAAILDSVAFSDGVGDVQPPPAPKHYCTVAAILDTIALGDGVPGMSNLLQHLNITVQ